MKIWTDLSSVLSQFMRLTDRQTDGQLSLQRGPVDAKFHAEGDAPHQPFFFSEKWAKCSFVWYKNLDRCFFRFVTIHAFDGQTDSFLIAIPRQHSMQRGNKRNKKLRYREKHSAFVMLS